MLKKKGGLEKGSVFVKEKGGCFALYFHSFYNSGKVTELKMSPALRVNMCAGSILTGIYSKKILHFFRVKKRKN